MIQYIMESTTTIDDSDINIYFYKHGKSKTKDDRRSERVHASGIKAPQQAHQGETTYNVRILTGAYSSKILILCNNTKPTE